MNAYLLHIVFHLKEIFKVYVMARLMRMTI